MKDAEKVIPEFELEIGGEKLEVKASYRTIFAYEKNTGKTFASLFLSNRQEFASIEVITEFLFAAVGHIDKKRYTREWILDNLTAEIVKTFTNEIFPQVINAAFTGKQEEEKNEIPAPKMTDSESEAG